ncbi:MAG: hypothetical protein JWM40_842 [Frankiales bacterium]|nr:hypothetical protein [Frankiales bacterium]
MRLVWKLVACVMRQGADGAELLVVDRPHAGTHIPIGTLVDGEAAETGALREISESTGVTDVQVVRTLSTWERHTLVNGVPVEQRWQVVELRLTTVALDEWSHTTESGVARCHWLRLDRFAIDSLHPAYGTFVELLLATRAG